MKRGMIVERTATGWWRVGLDTENRTIDVAAIGNDYHLGTRVVLVEGAEDWIMHREDAWLLATVGAMGDVARQRCVTEKEMRMLGAMLLLNASAAPEHAVNSLRKTARSLGHKFEGDE